MRQTGMLALAIVALVVGYGLWATNGRNQPFDALQTLNGNAVSAFAETTAADEYMTFESPVGTDYQVPSGRTLMITRVVFQSTLDGAAIVIGYGTNAVPAGASAPTSAISVVGRAHATDPVSPVVANAVADHFAVDIYAEIPASMYPFFQSSGVAQVQIFGVEQ